MPADSLNKKSTHYHACHIGGQKTHVSQLCLIIQHVLRLELSSLPSAVEPPPLPAPPTGRNLSRRRYKYHMVSWSRSPPPDARDRPSRRPITNSSSSPTRPTSVRGSAATHPSSSRASEQTEGCGGGHRCCSGKEVEYVAVQAGGRDHCGPECIERKQVFGNEVQECGRSSTCVIGLAPLKTVEGVTFATQGVGILLLGNRLHSIYGERVALRIRLIRTVYIYTNSPTD